jgi:hypothetical protein
MTSLYEFPDFMGSWFGSDVASSEKMLRPSRKSQHKSYQPVQEQHTDDAEGGDVESQMKSAALESRDSLSSGASTLMERDEPEQKKSSSRIDARVISDAIIGLSDGLTVPFALTAGLSALGSKNVVIYGGLAELTAGAISMGLGGYLGARSEE